MHTRTCALAPIYCLVHTSCNIVFFMHGNGWLILQLLPPPRQTQNYTHKRKHKSQTPKTKRPGNAYESGGEDDALLGSCDGGTTASCASHRARVRWPLAYTLLKNPGLSAFRKHRLPGTYSQSLLLGCWAERFFFQHP